MTRRRGNGLGDGDYCPLNPDHGQMYFLSGSDRQWCPDVEHAGRLASHPQGPAPATRSYWPKGTDALRKAVIQTTLPEIDITLLGG
jgi:hypothetical protein